MKILKKRIIQNQHQISQPNRRADITMFICLHYNSINYLYFIINYNIICMLTEKSV